MRRLAAALLVVSLTASASVARADRPACAETPSDAEVRQRLEILETLIQQNEPAVRRWFTTFALLHSAMLSGALIFAISTDQPAFRDTMIVGSISSGLALASLVVFIPPLMGAGDTLRSYPDGTPAERFTKMRVAEDILQRASGSVDFLHGWFPATASTVYVLAASQILLLGLEQLGGALSHSIGGAILGLGRILLHPTSPRDAWRRYTRRYPDAACEEPIPPPAETSWQFAPAPGGLGFTVRF